MLNKYYPPDFDPTKLSKLRLPKERQYTVRIMTPFNMRCNTCGDYIAKAKKFNARKETVMSESYLNLKIFRFYIRCPKCMAEITFRTNPETADYEMEKGAHRNFDALRLAELQQQAEIEREKEEEQLNPMKMLENRTKQSRDEMEELEKLAQLKEDNATKQGVDMSNLLQRVKTNEETQDWQQREAERIRQEDLEDQQLARKMLNKGLVAASDTDSGSDSDTGQPEAKRPRFFAANEGDGTKSTDMLTENQDKTPTTVASKVSLKKKIGGLVIVKKKTTSIHQPSTSK